MTRNEWVTVLFPRSTVLFEVHGQRVDFPVAQNESFLGGYLSHGLSQDGISSTSIY